MKKLCYCFVVVGTVLLLFTHVPKVSAMNTGFSTEQKSEEKKETFISNIELSFVEEEPDKTSIVCFDVNSDGMIAIGQASFEQKRVCVYSSEGDFQYGYTFHSSGDIGVEWDGNNLNIYFVRSSVIISVDPDGEILDVLDVPDSSENNSYKNHFIDSTERTIGDTTYTIRNDMGIFNWCASSYSQLVVTDAAGKETLLYDVNSAQLAKYLTVCFLVVIVFLIILVLAIASVKHERSTEMIDKPEIRNF